MTQKGFIFTADGLFSMIILFTVLALVAGVVESNTLEMHQDVSQLAKDAALVGLYTGKDAYNLGISSIPSNVSKFSSCQIVSRNQSGSVQKTKYCISQGV